MILTCIRPFGNFLPGDQIEVPDGALFDHQYFEAGYQPDTDPEGDEK